MRFLSTYRFIVPFVCAVATSAGAWGQEVSPVDNVMVGTFGAGALNFHNGAFTTYDGILECGLFEKATTLEWAAGNVADFPIGSAFGLSTRLFYHKANGSFTSPNPVSPYVALDDGTLVRMQSEQHLAAALDYVMFEPLLKWRALGPVYLAAGPAVGLATRAAFEQEEEIVSPNGLTFRNGGNTRTIVAGNFEEQGSGEARRSLRLGVTGAVGADLPLSRRLVLNPEVAWTQPFTNVLTTFEWKVQTLRAGIGLKYSFGSDAAPEPSPVVEAPAARPDPVVSLDAQGLLADGTRLETAEIVVTEDRSTEVMPLLPYVFFDANSSDLAARYARLGAADVSRFTESDLRDSVLGVYYHVLDIIGSRMLKYPEATITVTGCREPLDDASGSEALSAGRASTVKQYLTSTWRIDPSRISTTSRVLPQATSNRQLSDGREENRRAEITCSDARILAPVQRSSVARTVVPEAVVLVPRVQFPESITGWNASVADGTREPLWRGSGSGAPAGDILWKLDQDQVARSIPDAPNHSLTARLTSTSASGRELTSTRSIPVRRVVTSRRLNGEIVRDSVLERYALMFFDFDTPNLSDFNAPVVDLIQSRMRTTSAVRITGLTDRIGADDYNLSLSRKRAEAAGRTIQTRIVPNALGTTGAGEMLIYNNDLPEGRFYNRTVFIEIATPLSDR